ncbi:hypothetical protein GCM10020221_33340 [Streptomyces thioluteus]|uniref:Uncharacterized protein n=1 Tax=Streptomyces thioluteus TaxID=66431 RepID=A0ABN3X1Y9_STRTU
MGRPPRVDDHGGEVYVYRRAGAPCHLCGSEIRTAGLAAATSSGAGVQRHDRTAGHTRAGTGQRAHGSWRAARASRAAPGSYAWQAAPAVPFVPRWPNGGTAWPIPRLYRHAPPRISDQADGFRIGLLPRCPAGSRVGAA